MRVTRGVKARRRRNRILKAASGFRAGRRRLWRRAVDAVHRSWAQSYIGRKRRKRDMRRLWIARINAGARELGTSYSQLMAGVRVRNIGLDRKILAELAVLDSGAFANVVTLARTPAG